MLVIKQENHLALLDVYLKLCSTGGIGNTMLLMDYIVH